MSIEENGAMLLHPAVPETVTASDAVTGYEVSRAFTFLPSEIFDSGPIAGHLTIDMDFGAATGLWGIGLINHNLPAGTVVVVQFSGSGFDLFDSAEEVEITIPGESQTPANVYAFFGRKYRYVRIRIDGLNRVTIGEIFAAKKSLHFENNYSWGFSAEFTVAKQFDTTDDGIHFETPEYGDSDPVPEYMKLWYRFDDISQLQHVSLRDIIRVGPKIFIPDASLPECFHGRCPDSKLPVKHEKGKDVYAFRFWENAIGVTQ
ncbi:MAG: hypothetical protein KAW12_13410 [Candidatus Aminicenantes bacterium]|nr:hypothetical protein [Candidatus Aminicenantes bacterium]